MKTPIVQKLVALLLVVSCLGLVVFFLLKSSLFSLPSFLQPTSIQPDLNYTTTTQENKPYALGFKSEIGVLTTSPKTQ
jgi:hypothetical protein